MTWLFCAGMIRSGSTLQFQLTSAIVERAGIGIRLPYSPESDFKKVQDHCSGEYKFQVLKVHVYTPALAKECIEHSAAVIYSYRDIRDVAVSAMRKFGLSFSELMGAKWLEQAITDYSQWMKCPLVSVSRYEDFTENITGEAEKINRFLGSPLAIADVCRLAADYSIERQRVQIDRIKERHGRSILPKEIIFDPVELLHHNHIHQGEIGGWRRQLSDSEKSLLTIRFSDWLEKNGYDTRL